MEKASDIIKLSDYNYAWPQLAAAEELKLRHALRSLTTTIEHIGSTSIPGIRAKPVIDLMIGVNSLEAAHATIAPLSNHSYGYWEENPFKEHFFFVKRLPADDGGGRSHHVHVVEKSSDFWSSQILFRDYLRQHPTACAFYERIKCELAEKFRNDHDGYTNGKTEFVQEILKKAGFIESGKF